MLERQVTEEVMQMRLKAVGHLSSSEKKISAKIVLFLSVIQLLGKLFVAMGRKYYFCNLLLWQM